MFDVGGMFFGYLVCYYVIMLVHNYSNFNIVKIKIAPSILSADFGKLNEDIASIEPFCDWVHVDVMDGHFVPNITIGAPVVKKIKTGLLMDCHLMIENPEKYVDDFCKAGADLITVHSEATEDLAGLIKQIKDAGCKVGVSIKPKTSVDEILPYLGDLDVVLVMSVEPGFGGQSFMENSLDKIRMLRKLEPNLDIEVDGGINAETAKQVILAGANVLVSGSYIFGAEDREAAILSLKGE